MRSSTSAPSEIGGVEGDSGCVVWDWICDAGNAFVEVIQQVGGFIKGAAEVLFETVAGIAGLVWNIVECLIPWSAACRQNVQAVKDFVGALIDDPLGVLEAMWGGITQPIKDDWNNGNYGEALGRGFASLAEVVAGTKGASKVRLVEKVGDRSPTRSGGNSCSFDGDTPVLMANGGTKRIADVRVGDQVLAADPETGEQAARTVRVLWVHQDTLVELVTEDGGTLTTTTDHPFYNLTDREWQQASDLDVGDRLNTAEGATVRVADLRTGSARHDLAYNLTVDDLHTYYVRPDSLPTDSSVLVHNTCPQRDSDAGSYLVDQAFKAPKQVRPGTRRLEGEYINERGPGGVRIEPWVAYYDDYGRLVGRTDYNAGLPEQRISDVHHHVYVYGSGRNVQEIVKHAPGEFDPRNCPPS